MIFPDKKLIFIHVQKTGGRTLSQLLRRKVDMGTRINERLGMHYPLTRIIREYPEIDISDYTVLTIKRPPWERLASFHVHWTKAHISAGHPERIDPDPVKHYTKEMYSETRHTAFMNFISIDGVVHPKIHALDFNDLENETRTYFEEELDTVLDAVPTVGANTEPEYIELYQRHILNQEFIDFVAANSPREMEYFGYDIPKVN